MTTFKPQLDREIELLLEEARLFTLERAIVQSALDLVVGFGLQGARNNGRLALAGEGRARQVMIIQAGLADGRDPRIFRQLAQRRDDIVARLFGVGRMNADDGKNIRIFFRQLDRPLAAA